MSKVPGRLHTTGGVLFILCGIAHTIGQFSSLPLDDTGRTLESAMRSSTIPGTPFTYWNIMQCWGALYGAMTILFGVMLLACLRASGGHPRVRRVTAVTGAIGAAVQSAGSWYFNAYPPIFFMVPAGALLLMAAFWPERRPAPA
jgi:hypothetical protein